MKTVWQHAEKLAALGALVLAIPAFVLSILSYTTSQRALDLSERDFRASRALILKGDYNAENRKLLLAPIGEGITLQTCRLVAPPSISTGIRGVTTPNFEMLTGSLERDIQRAVDKLPRPRDSMGVLFPDRMLPVIIESVYLAKGEVHQARSVYDVTFDVNIMKDGPSLVTPKGILYVSDAPTLPEAELDKLWDQQVKKMKDAIEENNAR